MNFVLITGGCGKRGTAELLPLSTAEASSHSTRDECTLTTVLRGPSVIRSATRPFNLLMLLAPPPGTVISGAACLSNSGILSPLEIARYYVVHGWLKQMLFLPPWSLISSKEDKLDNKPLCNSNEDKCYGVPSVMSPENT